MMSLRAVQDILLFSVMGSTGLGRQRWSTFGATDPQRTFAMRVTGPGSIFEP